jgi:hypothetical protein
MAEDMGEEPVWEGETGRLKGALDNATDESRAEFRSTYMPTAAWKEDVRRGEGAEEE